MQPSSPESPSLWQSLNNSVLLRYILLFGCGWITVIVINYFYTTIALFTAAGLFAALLNYPVVWLSRYLPRWLAITLSFLGAVALLLGLVAILGLQVLNQGQELLDQLREALNQPDSPLPSVLGQLDISNVIATLRSGLASGLRLVQNLFSSIFTLIFGAVISLYMLIDGEKLWQLCLNRIPVAARDRFAKTFRDSFLGFLRGQLLVILFLSSTNLLAFLLLGVDYALFLALIVGVLDAIPGIGAILGIVVVTFLVFISQGTALTIKVLIVGIVLEQIQENYVRPKVMGDTLDLNPVLLFLSLFIGQRVAGLLGIFLAIPVAGMIAAWMRSAEAAKATPALNPVSQDNAQDNNV